MRQFSNQEKQLIYSIYQSKESNSYVLLNAFRHWFYGEDSIGYDVTTGKLVFDVNKKPSADDLLNIQKEIIQTALLIKYLEDNGLIYIIEDDATVENLEYIGKNLKQISVPLRVNLPKDIASIINRSRCRVYVSYALTLLVENDFRTYEELQLLASNEQLRASSQQLTISKAQLDEAKKQTEEAIKQTKEAQTQTAEAIEQTKQVNKQTEKVNEQTQKVNEQTDNSRTQVGYAWIAMACSIGALIASIVLPICFNRCSNEDSYRNEIKTSLQKSVQSTENISANVDSIKSIGKTVIIQNDSIIVNSQKQTDAINHTQRTTKTGVTKTKKRQ